jgi:hypothetical protein
MRPDRETNNAFIYCLAVSAARYGIKVLFTVAMSNHHHTGIYDADGSYPAFIEHFHKLFAKCQNALRGRWENFWSSEQTSVVRLVDPNDVLDKMTYALTNPVKDGLVERVSDWPGVSALDPILCSKVLVAERPRHFFREEGPMPEKVTLSFARPEGFADLSAHEFSAMVEERIREAEKVFALERRRTGVPVLGVKGVEAQRPTDSPSSRRQRREIVPRVAARSRWSRIEALLCNRAFRDAYAAARAALAAGIRDVVFPAGTYWLRRFTRAECAPCPTPG